MAKLHKLAKISNKMVEGKHNKQVFFRDIIKGFTGYKIKAYPKHVTEDLEEICIRTITLANNVMNFNEASSKIGLKFEEHYDKVINNTRRWSSWSPKTKLNANLSSGYPDTVAIRRRKWSPFKTKMYIEIKTASITALESSAPSFSWQNSIHGKIKESLPHILVSFVRDGHKFVGFKIVDLHNLKVGIEVKAVTGNKNVYANVISSSALKKPQ